MIVTNSQAWKSHAVTYIFLTALSVDAVAAIPPANSVQPAPGTAVAPASPPGSTGPGTPPPNLVAVNTTYLEQLSTTSKATVDAVSATAQRAIDASKDKEAWMVSVLQIVGIIITAIGFVFAALVGVLGFFGITKYKEMREYMDQISAAKKAANEAKIAAEEARDAAVKAGNDVKNNAELVDVATKDFISKHAEIESRLNSTKENVDGLSEKINEIETLFAGIHSQKLVMDSLRQSTQKVTDALDALEDGVKLYEIAAKLGNERIRSFMAANLALLYMYAEKWNEASKYGAESVKHNPRHWPDRQYNLACIFARKYESEGIQGDKINAINAIRAYFYRNEGEKISRVEIDEALADEDLASIRDEILLME
jgi:DNA-binding ferritin-like protein